MDLKVRAQDARLSPANRDYIDEKIGGAIRKVMPRDAVSVDVDVASPDHGASLSQYRVSVRVHVPRGKTEVVTVEKEGLRAAIDVASDKIARAMKRATNKPRARTRNRRAESNAMPAVDRPTKDDTVDAADVARELSSTP